MGFLDRLLGRDEPRATPTPRDSGGGELTDEQALERYRYLVRTELSAAVPAGERADRDDPRSLARMATRAELRDPGSVERAFGRGGMGMGMGIGGTLLGSFAAAFAGTIIAQSLMDELGGEGEGEGDAGGESEGGAGESADSGSGSGGDFGGGDLGGGFGGGDFGGGDAGGF